jgi:hypothetical protein
MVEGSFLKGDDNGLVELYVNHRGHTHYVTLHYITLHYIALHCIALHCIAFQSIGDAIISWH